MSKQKQSAAGRIRHSITSKFKRKLFFRLLWLFITLNISICIIAGVGLWLYSERKIMRAASMINVYDLPENNAWLQLAGMSVSQTTYPYPSLHYTSVRPFPWFMRPHGYWDDITYRGFRAEGSGFENTLRSIDYVVAVRHVSGNESTVYEILLNIGPFVFYFTCCLFALFAFELLILLSRTLRDRRMIRKTLDPIAELARAAQNINEANKQLDNDMAMALAGKLDGIDAGRLDTRIQVDDLQEELKSVAVSINSMLDRIYEAYAAQARFVSDASHELRTPIAVIQGYANLLDRWGKEDEKALAESVAAIKEEAGNMKDLVEQLLFLARGDSNRIRLTEERIELTELINDVADEARMLEDAFEFIVTGCDVAVIADKALIKQALRILVDNAVKYTDPGGEIKLSADKDSDKVRLSVTDTGIGIRPDVLPHVFDRFVRADESRTRATGGAGLGLSIAQWIAARHKGHMEVTSREGIGTRISLLLPAAPEIDPPKDADTRPILI